MIASVKELLPDCNQKVTGIVRYYTTEWESKLVANEKAKLLSNIAHLFTDRMNIVKCSVERLPEPDQSGANQLLITLKTYCANLLDCQIGEVCYYEHHECVDKLELDDDEYHFVKLNNIDYSLWMRIR